MTIDEFIRNAVNEDIGEGDHTSLACIPDGAVGRAKMIVKEKGVVAGTGIAEQIFLFIDPNLQVKTEIEDGEIVDPGTVIMTVSGKARSILMAERLALNCIQRMCGVATLTRKVMDKLEGLKTQVLDTRKTTPGLRFLEKMAVKIGGGTNHRFGLYDMMMIKDNHIDYAGGIEKALQYADEYRKSQGINIPLEIEARNLNELNTILSVGLADRIMLDNFSFEDLRTAVSLIPSHIETEASGGITLENVREYAECGVDFVSMGALTHSVSSLDISLKAY
jgi:nicotinate-nucleotide pyrophosphorylase (carboxylating)